jgi:hypothetical protein
MKSEGNDEPGAFEIQKKTYVTPNFSTFNKGLRSQENDNQWKSLFLEIMIRSKFQYQCLLSA